MKRHKKTWGGERADENKYLPALSLFSGPNIVENISILEVASSKILFLPDSLTAKCDFQLLFLLLFLFLLFKSKSSEGSGPSPSPYFLFWFTFCGHSNVRLISSDHISLSSSVVRAFAEQGGRESLKKNPFTLEVRQSWILTNATLMRGASGERSCVAQSADGWADMQLVLLLCSLVRGNREEK